ncbi:hypothetical protein ACFLTG_01755 [Chloroflexota bacterium]
MDEMVAQACVLGISGNTIAAQAGTGYFWSKGGYWRIQWGISVLDVQSRVASPS